MFYKIQAIFKVWCLLNVTGLQVVAQLITDSPVSYIVEAPEAVKAGGTFTITIVFNVETGWYVYAPIAMNAAQGKIATKVSYDFSVDFKKIGGLELSDKNKFLDTYRGNDVNMSQQFQVNKNTLPGQHVIKTNVVYQACNDDICYPPVREKIDVVITIKE